MIGKNTREKTRKRGAKEEPEANEQKTIPYCNKAKKFREPRSIRQSALSAREGKRSIPLKLMNIKPSQYLQIL